MNPAAEQFDWHGVGVLVAVAVAVLVPLAVAVGVAVAPPPLQDPTTDHRVGVTLGVQAELDVCAEMHL
jgi:hypothetical protein